MPHSFRADAAAPPLERPRTELADRLAEHRTLGAAPRAELEWIATRGTVRWLEIGDVVSHDGERIDTLWVLLSGHVAFYGGRGATRGKIADWFGGDAAGLLPYSRLKNSPGEAIAEERSELFELHRDHFPEMIRVAPTVTTVLVHVMLDRARHFTTSYLQDEKLVSLGKLSAGLAHELNNPASAAARSARLLRAAVTDASVAARTLGGTLLTDEQSATIERVQKASVGSTTRLWSALDFSDREDAFDAWLATHTLDPELSAALAETALTASELDELVEALTPAQLDATVRWIAADHVARTLAFELERSAIRIHELVSSVRRFTYMDRAAVAEPMHIAQGLEDAITVLASKMRRRSANIQVEIDTNLPPVRAFGGELNQVWHNLLDNALDAVPDGGRVHIRAFAKRDKVIVEIIDNGSGVPPEVRDQIFDPFFTTKGVGEGSGLGLDIARRIVIRHNGDIELESEPGRTVFRVTLLPAQEAGSESLVDPDQRL